VENALIFAQEQFVIIISLTAIVFLFIRYETSKGGEKLSCPQVVAAVNADEAILLDVRDTKEYDAGHIVNAINIPHAKVADSLKVLIANDFTAERLGGGITEWQQDSLPLVK
jgi:rhodanese-related sulfurtransferase